MNITLGVGIARQMGAGYHTVRHRVSIHVHKGSHDNNAVRLSKSKSAMSWLVRLYTCVCPMDGNSTKLIEAIMLKYDSEHRYKGVISHSNNISLS